MPTLLDYKRTKIKDGRWCEIQIKLEISPYKNNLIDEQQTAIREAELRWEDRNWTYLQTGLLLAGLDLRVSVCGAEGRVLTTASAKRQALEYWTSYFDDSPGEIIEMGKRFNKRFSSTRGAAKFVIETDGAMHGLDVHSEDNSTRRGQVLITESCGQIRDSLAQWFSEHTDLFAGHLSNMKAGAPDQERALLDMPEHWVAEYDNHYDAACGWLKERGILESKHEGWIFVTGRGFRPALGYKYGGGWVHSVIPFDMLDALRDLSIESQECAA